MNKNDAGYRLIGTLALLLMLVAVLPARAQDAPDDGQRDPAALAARLLGVQPQPFVPDLVPRYEVGDTLDFWVGKTTAETPTRITATLAAAAPGVYVWVENGIDYDPGAMPRFAAQVNGALDVVRWRTTYATPALPGAAAQVFDPTNLYPIPDVDNDPHVYVLYTTDLSEERDAVLNPNDSLPATLVPGAFANQHEIVYVNTSPFPNSAPSEGVYLGILLRGFYDLVFNTNFPDQPAWLREALGFRLLLASQETSVSAADIGAFLSAPDTPLIRPSTLTTRSPSLGAQQMFLGYLEQRYGAEVVRDLYRATGEGIAPVDAVLQAISDPVTGAPVTGRDAFADFVMTNALNVPFGDGRYLHRSVPLQPGQVASALEPEDVTNVELTGQSVSQFGTFYVRLQTPVSTGYRIEFEGDETAPRLSMPPGSDPDNHFYWSGGAQNRDHTLTRAFDLRDADGATLQFDVWHDLAEGWNYGYVEVSADGGETWDILAATTTSAGNRYGAAYGAGFTGISNPNPPRPFPVMGVLIQPDGMTVSEILPDGLAAGSDLQAGDVIVGYDGSEWEGAPNVLGMLSQYAPGDTLDLLILRNGEQQSVPLTLGASPTRIVYPEPLWQAQIVDLTPYAGREILVRFEYVSLPGREDSGFAVDNIAVPELDFRDDAETEGGWTAVGWQRVDNHVPQTFLVQAGTTGRSDRAPTVQRLLDPGAELSGEWRVGVLSGEALIIAVSGVSDDTAQPARFNLRVTPVE